MTRDINLREPDDGLSGRRIVYIVGCGRSGTTIFGFALGNIARAVDLGEVLDFVKFRGRPNGFGPETDNYKFWSSLLPEIECRLGERIDFDRLEKLQARVDTHRSLVMALIPGWRQADRQAWRRFLRALYDTLLADSRFDIIIDSSKYPSRLWHLQAIYQPENLCVIHLLRDPIAVAASRSTDEQSAPKNFLASIVYYIGVNSAARWLISRSPSQRSCTVFYEDLVSRPESELQRICAEFELDPGSSLDLVDAGRPLPRGYIFNGNRMRTSESIVLRKGQTQTVKHSALKRIIGNTLLYLFRPRARGLRKI